MTKRVILLALLIITLSGCEGNGSPTLSDPTEQAATAEANIVATRINRSTSTPVPTPTQSLTEETATVEPEAESKGDRIAFWRQVDDEVDVIVIDPDTREETNITVYRSSHAFRPVWSPEGNFIAYVADTDDNWDIYYLPADGSARVPRALTISMNPDLFPQWTPDGNFVTYYSFLDGQFDIMRVNIITHVQENLSPDTRESSESHAIWSPDGEMLLFISDRDKNDELYLMDYNGENVRRLSESPDAKEWDAAWSPDGSMIAFVSDREGNSEIYLIRPDGSELAQLTTNEGDDGIPIWSPSGDQLLFVSNREGNAEIYLLGMECLDSNEGCEDAAINLTNNQAEDSLPAWSPDGKRIAFVSTRDGLENIYLMGSDGSDPYNLTESEGQEWGPTWSPRSDGE